MNAVEWLIPIGPRRMSTEDYLAFEAASLIKHEYLCGWVFPMWGITEGRNTIVDNLAEEFSVHLRERVLEGQPGGIKVHTNTESGEILYYPKVVESRGLPNADDVFPDKPKLIVEVLSPSAMVTNGRDKPLSYRRINSLEEYAHVEPRKHKVILSRRAENWQPHVLSSVDAVAEFRSIGLSVPLSRIYEEVF